MKTEIIDNGKQVIAKFSGRLDTAAAVQTAEDVKPLMDKADSIFNKTNKIFFNSFIFQKKIAFRE